MKRKLIILVVIAGLIAGGVALYVKLSNQGLDKGVLLLSGNIEVTEVDVGFEIPGRVMELQKEEGDVVEEGETLASLDSAELETLVAQRKAALEEAGVKLRELRRGARPQEIDEARARLKQAAAELEKAKKDFDRADLLYSNGAISAQQMDAARRALEVADARYTEYVKRLSLVEEGPRKEEIEAQESRVRQARAALDAAGEKLKDSVISASVSGVILRKNVEAGETVSTGMPVYTIGDIEKPWVKVYVKEDKLGLVKLGQRANVTVDSYPRKIYKGTVTYISSEAEFTPKNVQTQEERVKLVFGMKVSVENPEGELKPGMPADVRILLND